jgi:Ca-activated chloride channel family protein
VSFAQPVWLLSLLVVPLVVGLLLLAERRQARSAVRFTNLDVLATVVAGARPWRRYAAAGGFVLSLAALCVAIARPRLPTLIAKNAATVILVIDVSGSMHATDVKPSRMQAAQRAATIFLDHAPRQLRVGLIAFAGEPQVATPPTTDHRFVAEAIASIDQFSGFDGTAIGDALALAVEIAEQAVGPTGPSPGTTTTIAFHPHGPQSPASILFLSDGAQTRGALQPLQGAALAKAAGIPVYTAALGTPTGTITIQAPDSGPYGNFGETIPVPPDPATLHAIATLTGGKFVDAQNAHTLMSAYASLGSRLARKPGTREITNEFVLLAAALLLTAGLASALWSPRLP